MTAQYRFTNYLKFCEARRSDAVGRFAVSASMLPSEEGHSGYDSQPSIGIRPTYTAVTTGVALES